MTTYNIIQNYAGLKAGDVITLEGEPDEQLRRGIAGGILVPEKTKSKPKPKAEVEDNGPIETKSDSNKED